MFCINLLIKYLKTKKSHRKYNNSEYAHFKDKLKRSLQIQLYHVVHAVFSFHTNVHCIPYLNRFLIESFKNCSRSKRFLIRHKNRRAPTMPMSRDLKKTEKLRRISF